MDGIHDLGGRQGYGSIDVNESDEPFHAPWEARLLGIVRAMSWPAPWSIDWFRQCRELIDPIDYLGRPYYDQWLQTYAAMMVDSGVASVEEVATGKSVGDIRRVTAPMTPAAVASARKAMTRFDREIATLPRFAVGDDVTTKRDGSAGHTRLPQYARGRRGRVESINGAHVLPDSNPRGDGYAEPLYTVSLATAELWPESSGRKDRVFLDLWESYLEPT